MRLNNRFEIFNNMEQTQKIKDLKKPVLGNLGKSENRNKNRRPRKKRREKK